MAGRDRRMRTLARGILAAYAVWSCLYVARTSFLVGPYRVFSLWDDAMISMTYARNLAEGHGLVWNAGGERVQGFSNLGVVLVMAALHLLPVGPLRTAALFQAFQVVLLAWSLYALSRLPSLFWGADAGEEPATLAVAALFAPLSIWALQGSDVGLLAAALVTAAWLAGRSVTRHRSIGFSPFVVLAVAVVMRADAALFYMVYLAVAAREPGSRWRLAAAAGLLAATLGAIAAFGWLYYGDPLPNTYYLKATGAPRRLVLQRGLAELWQVLVFASPFVVAAVAWMRAIPARAPLLLLWGPAALGVAYNTWVGGDWRPDYLSRFVVPGLALVLPLAVAASRWLAAILAERAALGERGRRAFSTAILAGFVLQAGPPTALVEWLWPRGETLLRDWNLENARHGLYFAAFTAPGTTLALHWAGVPAYLARRPCVDVLGRSDTHIARLRVDLHEPGHSKWDWDYVLAVRRPDVFQHESRGLADREDFRRDYLRARTPEGLEFFLRRDARARLRDPLVVLEPLAAAEALSRPGPTAAPGGID